VSVFLQAAQTACDEFLQARTSFRRVICRQLSRLAASTARQRLDCSVCAMRYLAATGNLITAVRVFRWVRCFGNGRQLAIAAQRFCIPPCRVHPRASRPFCPLRARHTASRRIRDLFWCCHLRERFRQWNRSPAPVLRRMAQFAARDVNTKWVFSGFSVWHILAGTCRTATLVD